MYQLKLAAFVITLLSICACTASGHYEADEFDLVKLKSAIAQLDNVQTNGNRVEKRWWPPEIANLKPEYMRISKSGVYIVLDSFFVEERGLFIPAPGIRVETEAHQDPNFRLLGEGVYSYYVTG